MILHRYALETLLPNRLLVTLHMKSWYRKMFGGHWELRSWEPALGGSLEDQRYWMPTSECWCDAGVLIHYGVEILRCEHYGPEPLVYHHE